MDRQVPDRPATSPATSPTPAGPDAGQVVFGNRWDQLSVPELGAWTPTRRVSVVLPHYQAPDALDITLAALSAQSYPAELIQVVVADDGSTPPLELPADHRGLDVTVVRQEDEGFRLAAVRNLGAEAAAGDVLIFLDHDMVPEPRHLEAHARWHHACQHAVTLGFRRHVAFDGISADEVLAAAQAGSLAPLFAGRPVSEPAWLERHMDRMSELTADHDDLFRATTGGNLGIRAETFHAVGGFDATFTQWGSEDTDLGHRLFLAGALLVPERAAACWHQGDSRGLEPHERASLDDQRARISQEVAHLGFRRVAPGRSFRVPRLLITVRVTDEPHATITATLESVLASHLHDLEVLLVLPEDHPDRVRVLREWAGDPRVIEHERDAHDRTPYRMELPVGAALAPETLHGVLAAMTDPTVPTGVLHVPLGGSSAAGASASAEAAGDGSASAEALVVSQRALARARTIGAADELQSAGELFGLRTIAGDDLRLRWAPVTELTRVPRPALPLPASSTDPDADAGAAAATGPSGKAEQASRRSRAGSWLLVDTPLGWLTRGTARELFADADRRVTAAEQAAATARHEAAVARFERDRVANRKAVRLATEVANTAGGRSVRSLPNRLRAATDPLPRAEQPGPAPEVVAPTTVARDRSQAFDERGLLPPRPVRAAPFPHLRVLHLGAAGRFLHLADHTAVDPDTWRDQLRSGADVVLLEPPANAPGWDPLGGELPALLRAARELGIPSVRLAVPSSRGGPGEATLDLIEGAPGGADTVAPSVDTSVLNPMGWRHQPPDPVVAVLDRTPDASGRELLAAFDPPVVLVHPSDLPAIGDEFGIRRSVSSPAGLRRSLIRAGVLLDHASWRGDATERLRTWTAALACGTPVVAVVDDPDRAGTDAAGADELAFGDGTRVSVPPGVIVTTPGEAVETVHRLLIDVDLRERHGIVGRRWALRAGSRETVLREILGHLDVPVPAPPRTTVLLATNRPDFIERGLANVARQTQAGVDVSLVLHGSAFDRVDLPERDGLVSSVVRAPDHWLLGDCLNVALDHAQGELIAKMDDDDHYGPEHISDLVTAWHYSGADIVGKRIEYIHLAERGITVRRPSSRPERDRPHVGGPTLFGSRDTLRRHRFLRVPNRVDSTLYERVIADGGRVYGIHSRDLVLERHGHGHAWAAADEDFLADAIEQRDGLALDLATSDPITGT